MKKESCSKLLELLKKFEFELSSDSISISTAELLDLDDEIVKEIIKIDDGRKLELVFKVITKYKNNTGKYLFLQFLKYIVNEVENEDKVKRLNKILDITDNLTSPIIELARTLVNCKSRVSFERGMEVLSDKCAIEAGIAIDGAMLVANCEEVYQVVYTADILENKSCIENQIALPGAKIIVGMKNEDDAKAIAYILKNRYLLEKGISLQSAQVAAQCNYEHRLHKVHGLLLDYNLMQTAYYYVDELNDLDVLRVIEEIISVEEEYKVKVLMNLFGNGYILKNANDLFKLLTFVRIAGNEQQANKIYDVITTHFQDDAPIKMPEIIQELESITGSKMVYWENIKDYNLDELFKLVGDCKDKEINSETVKQFIKKNNR